MNAYELGQKLLWGGYTSYTPTGKSYFVKHGKAGSVPHRGDVIYFYTESLGRVSHVGIVSAVDDLGDKYTICCIEGNTAAGKRFERDGGECAAKFYTFKKGDVGGKNRINCFCTPDFAGTGITPDSFVACAKEWLDYVEKASNGTEGQLKDKNWNPGDANYTWFGKWYGMNPAQWCQMFVSFCAYSAAQKKLSTAAAKWIQSGDKWKYLKDNGTYAVNEWLFINGRWYVFDGNGIMITGWFSADQQDWYFLGMDGGMLSSQWILWKDKYYYLTETGLMARNSYIRSAEPTCDHGSYTYYYVDKEGVWTTKKDTNAPDGSIDIVR